MRLLSFRLELPFYLNPLVATQGKVEVLLWLILQELEKVSSHLVEGVGCSRVVDSGRREKSVNQSVDQQSTHRSAVVVLPRPHHSREVAHVLVGAVVALLCRGDLIARLGALPRLRDSVRVIEGEVIVLESRLYLELECVAGELHPHHALVDAHLRCGIPRNQGISHPVQHSSRPVLVRVGFSQRVRHYEDHVQVGYGVHGGVPSVRTHHQSVVGRAVFAAKLLIERLRDLIATSRDGHVLPAHLKILQ